jgi:DNA-binding HxlR family transcriptional regulator
VRNKRSYDDRCGAARALDLIGERWALLVARELLLGPKRFTDLRAGLPGISPNILSQRLHEFEQAAIIGRRRLAPPASGWVYQLTEWGQQLEPVIRELARWGFRSPFFDRNSHLNVDSLILSFRTTFSPPPGERLTAELELRFEDHRFRAVVDGDSFEVGRGCCERPDVIVDTDPLTLAGVVFEGRNLGDAVRSGKLRLQGEAAVVVRFVSLFRLPEPAPVGYGSTARRP